MWTRIAAFGLWRSAFASKSSKDMQRSLAVAVDELDLGAGVDRGQRRRHEGVGRAEHRLAPARRRTRAPPGRRRPSWRGRGWAARSTRPSAARRPPASRPSDHCSESSTSVQSSKRRARSRWSNPIANLVASGRVVSAEPTVAPWVSVAGRLPSRDDGSHAPKAAARLAAKPDQIPDGLGDHSPAWAVSITRADRPGAREEDRAGDARRP